MDLFEEDYLEEDRETEDILINTIPTQERLSFLMIPTTMLRNSLFLEWDCTARSKTAKYLYSYTLRKCMKYPMLEYIFKEFYEKRGLLVARFTQQRMAVELGYKDRRGINNHMVKLEDEGIYKVHFVPWKNRVIRVYEFGTWEMYKDTKIETLHMFAKFDKEFADLQHKEFYPNR